VNIRETVVPRTNFARFLITSLAQETKFGLEELPMTGQLV
jgi:hypothetical protein